MMSSQVTSPDAKYQVLEFATWDELYRAYRGTFAMHQTFGSGRKAGEPLWIFRGQSDCSWCLKTKLEREFRAAEVDPERYGFFEEGLIREFQRRLQTAEELTSIPDTDNVLAWLALMQHHGAPTRLLDWSYSFFIGLFFAVEAGADDAAVYAVDSRWCNEQSRQKLPSPAAATSGIAKDPYFTKSSTFKNLFACEPKIPLVYRVNTFLLNTRLAVQQGLFLCPGDLSQGFEENLDSLCAEDPNNGRQSLYKLRIRKHARAEILAELSYMNIARHSLFPGIDGFAQSIAQFLRHSDRLYPPWRKKQLTSPFSEWSTWQGWDGK